MKQPTSLILFVLSVLLFTLTATVHSSADREAKIDPRLNPLLAGGRTAEFLIVLREQAGLEAAAGIRDKTERGRYVYETLTATAARAQSQIRAILDRQGVSYRPYWVSNLIWVRGDLDLVESLARRADVGYIYANVWQPMQAPIRTIMSTGQARANGVEWNIALVGAPDVWARGFNGQGAVIGGQDTGYDWTHPAIKNQYRGWDGLSATHDYNWHDAIHEDNPVTSPGNECGFDARFPCDDEGHGTHTMGTMVGDDGAGAQIGMAPGASWIGCRNMEEGWGTPATYTECYEWFIAPYPIGGNSFTDGDPAKAPDVINNSWSCPPSEGCIEADLLKQVVENVRMAGILTAHSAGNSGSLGCASINTPAGIYDASFTVGATTSSDQVAFFSSRGPVSIDGSNRLKPEIVAPGEIIYSSSLGGGYTFLSGTSMASPHVAGLVALLVSAEPGLSGQVDELESLVTQTAVPLTTDEGCGGDGPATIPNNVYGWGRIDAMAAVEAARPIVDTHSLYMPLLVGSR